MKYWFVPLRYEATPTTEAFLLETAVTESQDIRLLVCRTSLVNVFFKVITRKFIVNLIFVTSLVIIGYCCGVPAMCSCESTCQSNSEESNTTTFIMCQ